MLARDTIGRQAPLERRVEDGLPSVLGAALVAPLIIAQLAPQHVIEEITRRHGGRPQDVISLARRCRRGIGPVKVRNLSPRIALLACTLHLPVVLPILARHHPTVDLASLSEVFSITPGTRRLVGPSAADPATFRGSTTAVRPRRPPPVQASLELPLETCSQPGLPPALCCPCTPPPCHRGFLSVCCDRTYRPPEDLKGLKIKLKLETWPMVGPVQYVCIQSKRQFLAIAVPIGKTEYILACFQFPPTTVVKPRGKMA